MEKVYEKKQKNPLLQKKSNGGTVSKSIDQSVRQQKAHVVQRRRSLGRREKIRYTLKNQFYGRLNDFDSDKNSLFYEAKESLKDKLSTFSNVINAKNISRYVLFYIKEIHKNIILVPQETYNYAISVDIYPDSNRFEVSVKLKNEQKYKKIGLNAKRKEEELFAFEKKDKAQRKAQKEADFNFKYEKIYDSRMESILPSVLERAAEKFRKRYVLLENEIYQSYDSYRERYDNFSTIGRISAAASLNFRKPKLDHYWWNALKNCKKMAQQEEILLFHWKHDELIKYIKEDSVPELPYFIKEKIDQPKVLDEWIRGRGTNYMIKYSMAMYGQGLSDRLFDIEYEMKEGERLWNTWVEESVKGAGRVVTGLTIAKNAGGVAAGTIGTITGVPAIGIAYSMVQEGASQSGEYLAGSDKAFNLWKIGKAGLLAYFGAKVGDIGKRLSIIVDGVEKTIPQSCMAKFLIDSTVAESIKFIDDTASKNKTPDEIISLLVERPSVQNVFQSILTNCK